MSEGGRVRRKRKSRIPVRQATGLYVHSSPPTVLPVHPSIVRQWLRGGEVGRLQDIVLKKKVQELHDAARAGSIDQVDAIVKSESRINLELSRDSAGTGILHKAVIHGHVPLQEFLLKNYPKTVEVLDRERRNPLHYAAGNEEVWNRLVAGGADTTTVDREGFSPAFYMNHPRRLRPPAPESRSKAPTTNQGLVVKPSTIRIWIHDKDLGRLQKVLWEGLGDKLKTETSSQPLVRRFLNAVPYIMGLIRDVHSAAVSNDLELLQSKGADPVPKDILLSKDANGLNPLHKAAGLGHMEVARAIIERAPDAVNAKDHQDRTPLHYAAALKDQNQMYQLLVDSDATDHLEDKKGNTPSHYRARPSELEAPKLLNVVPDAPRTAHIFPPSWDWRLLTGESTGETPITSPQTEAPPRMPKTQPKEAEEPKSEPPEEEVEVRKVEDKPPEIEPTPEEDEKVEVPEESKVEDAPAISDDEGVGSEANPSVENTSTPLSDTVNEEEEITGARLGETMTLSSSLFRSHAPRIEESGNGNDSGNEEGDSSEGKAINEENGEVEPSNAIAQNNSEDTAALPAVRTADQTVDIDSREQEELLNGDYDDATQPETVQESSRPTSINTGSVSHSGNPATPNEHNQSSRPNTAIEQMAQSDNVNGEEADDKAETVETGEPIDDQNHINTTRIEDGAKNDEGKDDSQSTNQNLGSSQDLNGTYTKIPTVDALAVNENGVSEVGVEDNTTEEADAELSNQLGEDTGDASYIDDDNNETDEKNGENETSTVQGPESNTNQTNESKNDDEIPKSDADQATESQSRPCSHGNDVSKPQTAAETNGVQEDAETQESEENQLTDAESAGPKTAEREEHSTPNQGAQPSSTDGDIAPESSADGKAEKAENVGASDNPDDPIGRVTGTAEVDVDVEEPKETPATSEETEGKDEGTPGGDEIGKDTLDQPITLRSAGGSRAEVLAITPAPPEEDDALGDDQKAVAEGNTEADRAVAEELVAAGDMESMAEMVLNGKGAALLNMNSNNADVQLFINNIPQYIAKIERVHTAAREGDLRGVQTALDRRKFAVARDNNTPLKPTPLHVAALFGRTSVLRYLAGRFPETMHAQDAGGRTALHYAATLPDNGHFYSLLITLGADKSVIDNEGRTAEHYLRNKGELTRDELLNEYQNRPVPIDTTGLNFNRFSDKVENDQVSSRKDVDDQALLARLDACLRLIRMRAPGTLLNRVLQDDVYHEMKLRCTRLDNTLLDLITPGVRDIALGKSRLDSDRLFTGLSAPDYESYEVFEEILLPSIRDVNGIDENQDTPVQPPKDFFGADGRESFLKMNVDPSGMILKSFMVEISRNLQVATPPKNLKLSELEKVEVAVSATLTLFYRKNKENTFVDESGENFGSYYSLNEVNENKEVFDDLEQEELVAEGMNEPISDTWPYGRGVFVSPFGDVAAWVNVRDHLKLYVITSSETSGAVGVAYTTAADIVDLLEEKMEPKRDSKLGYLTSDPAFVGTGMRFKSLLNVPHLSQDRLALRKLCREHGLIMKPARKLSQYRVYSTVCLGITEVESFKKYVESLNVIIEAERNHMKGTIAQIPHLIKTLLNKKTK